MCGRCASARSSDKIRRACAYRPRGRSRAVKPPWVSSCSSLKYYPCYNLSPQMNSPILLSSKHPHIQASCHHTAPGDQAMRGPAEGETGEGLGGRVLQPMKWGLVPSWRNSDQGGRKGSFPLLNNCRIEGITEKPSFRCALEKRRRCVVLADGFFEWDRKGKLKRPYFIYFQNKKAMEELSMDEEDGAEAERDGDEEGASCGGGERDVQAKRSSLEEEEKERILTGRMLTMAGLFDISTGQAEGEPLYTYTIITVEAHQEFSHIHSRMPAILDGEDDLEAWLNPALASEEAIKRLGPSSALTWYPVSDVVNNVRNRTSECIRKIDPSKEVSRNQKTLLSWFSKSSSGGTQACKGGKDDTSPPPNKKPRRDLI